MPERVVYNSFFKDVGEPVHVLFRGGHQRHHVAPGEQAAEMIRRAGLKLAERLNLDLARDVDILMTNVTLPDQPFTGCGAAVSHALGLKPQWILDLHNGGCVSFIQMMACAQALMTAHGARTALLCNVQNAAGRMFSSGENRRRKQARIPGDGCGVGYLVANTECPGRRGAAGGRRGTGRGPALRRLERTSCRRLSPACNWRCRPG
jgi:3-oxoacyl-[acyl-carrier-protein] synthase-3